MRVLPYGERAVLIETETPLALRDALASAAGVVEIVPASRTLLVRFDPQRATAEDVAALAARPVPPASATVGELIKLPVTYDGVDLEAVAAETRLSLEEVIARHSSGEYVVAFCGFAPGFAYLTGLDPALHLPRLAEPRTSVPAGSVAIAAEFTGVYPRSSPGGWRLLGRTETTLWDVARPDPALLSPGTRVRFTRS
ncbi:MAG TPA: 5-oxoprolinase subunit PxpB [Jatrophihabitans sp.]|jgi:KipI family sensor histidine kinase inhibitor